MSESATDRVRKAIAAGDKPKRGDLSHYFRETLCVGKRAAEAYAAAFVRAELAAEDPPVDPKVEIAEASMRTLLDAISRR